MSLVFHVSLSQNGGVGGPVPANVLVHLFCNAIVIIFFLPIHGFKMYSKDSTKPSVQQSTWIQSGNVVRHQVTWFKFPFSTSLLIRNIYINVGMIFTKFSITSTFDYISIRYPANTCFLGKIIHRYHYILFEKIFIIIWWLSFNILSSYVKQWGEIKNNFSFCYIYGTIIYIYIKSFKKGLVSYSNNKSFPLHNTIIQIECFLTHKSCLKRFFYFHILCWNEELT